MIVAILGFSAWAKLMLPDRRELQELATRLGLDGTVLEGIYLGLALIEAGIALAILLRIEVERALWASLSLSLVGLAAWVGVSAFRAGCACFGAVPISPLQRLALIGALLGLSFGALWCRLGEADAKP